MVPLSKELATVIDSSWESLPTSDGKDPVKGDPEKLGKVRSVNCPINELMEPVNVLLEKKLTETRFVRPFELNKKCFSYCSRQYVYPFGIEYCYNA